MQEQDGNKVLGYLAELAREISQGEYDRAQEVFKLTSGSNSHAEIQDLAEAIGLMLVQVEAREFHLEKLIEELKQTNEQLEITLGKVRLLENIKNAVTKFVPQRVTRLIEANPEAPDLSKQEQDVSVLFLDVAGYTRMSEESDFERMNYLLERYFSEFLDVIHDHGGDINETAGDGLMILFQDPDRSSHALNACSTALGIQDGVSRINGEERTRLEPITVNIGINSGQCLVGSTRFEGVSGTRWTYTASGPVTNMAARIGALAANGKILIGEETHRRVKNRFSTEETGTHALKNIRKPVQVFELVPAVGSN